jgi:hypothetical protein
MQYALRRSGKTLASSGWLRQDGGKGEEHYGGI